MTSQHCIILIDDDESTNFINQVFLRATDKFIKFKAFKSAEDALDFLLKEMVLGNTGPCALPGIILLDLNLPDMDGWEFLAELNKMPENLVKRIKIIILSSSENPEDKKRAFETGIVNDYIVKPLTPDIIKKLIEKYL